MAPPEAARSVRPQEAGDMGRVVLGRVTGAHGLAGEVRVRWLGDGPEHLEQAAELTLTADPGGSTGQVYAVEASGAARPGELRLSLAGVGDRLAAQALTGLYAVTDASALQPLPEGESYWYQWIGCRVEASDGSPVGVVRELWETGAHDVLVIDAADGTQRLVPTADELLKEVDIEGRRIVVEAIPGLLDPA